MAAALTGCDAGEPSPPAAASGSSTTPPTSTTGRRASQQGQPLNGVTFLVWVPGGVPEGTEEKLQRVDGVTLTTTVTGGLAWIDDASEGRRPPPGYRYPFEITYIRPSAYAALIEGARIPEVERLGAGQLLLAETEAGLREAGTGLGLTVDGRRMLVRGVVPDAVTSGYEALAVGPAPSGWGDDYVLVRSESQPPLERAMARFVEPGKRFRVVGVGSTPFLRYADRVSPQMYYKQRFGEFAARPGAGGSLQVERGWVRRNIVHARLPLIGRVTCHRKYVAELRAGLRAIVRAGLADQIKPEEYAGCYNARHIGWDPTERLSSHAWGAAVDINAASNPLGSAPTIDRRIVRLLERAGLNWGGDWLVPDGMHFEWEAPTG